MAETGARGLVVSHMQGYEEISLSTSFLIDDAFKTKPGHTSLYNICQDQYELWYDEHQDDEDLLWFEKVEPYTCFCGYQHHTITWHGTPILYKKEDKVTVITYGMAMEIKGLMPRDYVPVYANERLYLIGKVVESLGKTVTE